MKQTLLAAFTIAALFPVDRVSAAPPGNPQLTQQQKQQLLGEVIGVGIAGAVIGAAINEQNHQRNGWNNNNNNNRNWNNNNGNNWNNNNGWNNNGSRRYDYIPPSSSQRQSTPVYRETYTSQPERVYSQQPAYYSTIEGERIISSSPISTSQRVISSSPVISASPVISSSPVITSERFISSSPVITSEHVISSNPSISSERVISSSPSISSERVVSSTPVKENSLPYKGPGVTVRLTKETGGNVAYLIDGVEEATIEAGQEQTLTKKGKYEIRFSRGRSPEGKDFGQARYTITEGAYDFEVTEKGWELRRDKDSSPTAVASSSPSGLKTNALPPKSVASSVPASVLVAAPTTTAPAEASGSATPAAFQAPINP